MDDLAKVRSRMGRRYKITNELILLKFFRFLITKLPERNLVFNIKKGIIRQKQVGRRGRGLYISVKDPFLPAENHGYFL